MMKKNISAIFCLFMLGAGLCLAQSEQPSLAEMAKRNKTKSKPVKTFTEADLPSKGLATDTAAAPATQKTSNETTAAAVASDGKKAGSKETSPGPKDAPAVAQLKKQIETYRDRETRGKAQQTDMKRCWQTRQMISDARPTQKPSKTTRKMPRFTRKRLVRRNQSW
jgi:hypothetical protein